MVLANPDLKSLEPILKNGNIPVIITSNLQWLQASATAPAGEKLGSTLEAWRRDWQAQDTDQYLAHYSDGFFSQDADFEKWAKDKRRIQADQPKVDIKLSNISMFRYPHSEHQMAMVTFDQEYKSPYLDSRIKKRQYWVLENQQWKIMYEGPA